MATLQKGIRLAPPQVLRGLLGQGCPLELTAVMKGKEGVMGGSLV